MTVQLRRFQSSASTQRATFLCFDLSRSLDNFSSSSSPSLSFFAYCGNKGNKFAFTGFNCDVLQNMIYQPPPASPPPPPRVSPVSLTLLSLLWTRQYISPFSVHLVTRCLDCTSWLILTSVSSEHNKVRDSCGWFELRGARNSLR